MLVCGSGVGAAVAACKLTGIRAAICHDTYSAHQGVEHDDMNVLCLGSEVVGPSLARELVDAFLGATFDGGERYVARLEKVAEMEREMKRMAKSRLHELAERGQSVWFDTLSRDLVHTGELKRMMDEDAVVGVTSNPTIFQKALSSGDAYDDDLKQLLGKTDDATEIFFSLALQDIRDACDVLKPAYDASDGVDGYVSMEVEPGIAYDTERTFEQVQWIAKEVDRPNLYVKIPATMPGLPAIEDSIAHGTSINITLIFSLERYKAVVEAYLRGLERLIAHGGDPSKVVVGRVVLRLARRHRGRQAPRGRGAPRARGQAGDREREARLPALPARRSRARAGRTSRARARRSSAASGRRPRPRTRPTAT